MSKLNKKKASSSITTRKDLETRKQQEQQQQQRQKNIHLKIKKSVYTDFPFFIPCFAGLMLSFCTIVILWISCIVDSRCANGILLHNNILYLMVLCIMFVSWRTGTYTMYNFQLHIFNARAFSLGCVHFFSWCCCCCCYCLVLSVCDFHHIFFFSSLLPSHGAAFCSNLYVELGFDRQIIFAVLVDTSFSVCFCIYTVVFHANVFEFVRMKFSALNSFNDAQHFCVFRNKISMCAVLSRVRNSTHILTAQIAQ